MNAPAVLLKISQRFHTLRRRHLAVRIGIAVAVSVVALALAWIILAGCDYLWELPIAWRRGVAGVAVGVVGLGLVWQLFQAVRQTRTRTFAALLETSFAEFGQRIRTVLDTVDGRVGGPSVMLAALGHQTLGRWETSTPDRILPLRKLLIGIALAIMAMVAAAAFYHAGSQWRTAMLRAAGSDVPYTTFQVIPGNQTILEGLSIEVALRLEGRTNRDVTLHYRPLPFEAAGEAAETSVPEDWIELELAAAEHDSALFTSQLGKANRPLEYQFVTSVGATDTFRIDVRPRIEARRIMTTVQPPAYTQLESRTFDATEATVLEQSQVEVTVEVNHPLHETKLVINGEVVSAATAIPSDDHRQWTFSLPSSQTLSWQFSGSGSDSTPMKPVSGRLRVRADQPPNLIWREPTQELRVSTLAEVPMHLLVSDDYGLKEAAIVFQLGGEEEYELVHWTDEDQAAGSPPTTRLPLAEILPLESLSLTERDYISYYAYAMDNRSPNPVRIESDVRYIDIRPLRQFFSEIDLPPNMGGGSSLLVQLDEIIRRQRFMINRTRRLTRSTGEELTNQLRSIDRLVENQSELAGITRFLAEFLISRGNDDVEALNQAEATMLQASDSLAAANFDLALVQQEDALRSLAEARRTVELVLTKNRSRAQQLAMQRAAQQLRQKLRRDRPETEQEIADTLQQIARQQAELAAHAKSLSQSQPMTGGNQPQASTGSPTTEPTPKSPDDMPMDSPKEATDQPSEEATVEEQMETLYAEQIDLLERVRAIEENITDRLSSSKLLSSRMREAQAAMNSLATQARDAELQTFPAEAEEASRQLAEMGVQLKALAATEAVNRISSARDLTTSLANMENALADQFYPVGEKEKADLAESNNQGQRAAQQATQLQRRIETIEDVLNAPVEIGDAETSEVNDQLQRLVEENEFTRLLNHSKENLGTVQDSAEEMADREKKAFAQEAYDRAVQYAEVAVQLDELFRQLVEPRMARLRQLEQKATTLAQQMQQGSGSGKQEEAKQTEELSPEDKAGLAQLERQLRSEGLEELAEMLAGNSAQGASNDNGNRQAEEFDPALRNSSRGRVLLVVREIQSRIQEMILQDIIPDRDVPVPPQYQHAVDRYLRVLAGEAAVTDGKGESND